MRKMSVKFCLGVIVSFCFIVLFYGKTYAVISVQNSSFEEDGMAGQNPKGWLITPNAHKNASYTERGGHTGAYRLKHSKLSDYKVMTSSTVNNIPNGIYTARAWVASTGGQTSNYFFVKDYGDKQRIIDIPSSSSWVQISIPDIKITNGKAVIGFFSDSPAGKGTVMDDIEFIKQESESQEKDKEEKKEYKFDFDHPENVETEDERVSVGIKAYNIEDGFGWANISGIQSRNRNRGTLVERDFQCGNNVDGTFRVNIPEGKYKVTVYSGDMSFSQKSTDIYAQGEKVVSGLKTSVGEIATMSFEVDVRSNKILEIEFKSNNYWIINALDITSLLGHDGSTEEGTDESTEEGTDGSTEEGTDESGDKEEKKEYNFDFDHPENVETEDKRVSVGIKAYNIEDGFGWTNISGIQSRIRNKGNLVERDFHCGNNVYGTFRVNIPEGKYKVTVYSGDMSFPQNSTDIYAQGKKVVSGLKTSVGEIANRSFEVDVSSNEILKIELNSNNYWIINALDITSLLGQDGSAEGSTDENTDDDTIGGSDSSGNSGDFNMDYVNSGEGFYVQNPYTSGTTGNSKYFTESGGIQTFFLPAGATPSWGDSKYARSEAHGNMEWRKNEGWHVFNADYTIPEAASTNIAQVMNFDQSNSDLWKPTLMVFAHSNGSITLWKSGKKVASYIPGKEFNLKILSNGSENKLYIDNKLVASISHSRNSGVNYFKWGAYGGEGDRTIILSNVVQGICN